MTTPDAPSDFNAMVLSDDDPDDRRLLDELRDDARYVFTDHRDGMLEGLQQLRPLPGPDVIGEPTRWAYYPWRRAVVGILGPTGYRALRLDRNRNLITAEEQLFLGGLRIGVAGLSVGHVIAHTLAAQGLCGTLRLADFDLLELSNLNRVPATVLDVGLNKAIVAARRIAELDPYLNVEVMTSGLTPEGLDAFLDGLDVVVEECDSLAMKVMVREAARDRRLPVLMATSDRGLIDVERYDLEPRRPILHGLLGDVTSAQLIDQPSRDNVPYMLRHLDASQSSQRFTASLIEMGKSVSTWPQVAGDVALGAAAVAEAVRRIGLNEPLSSGQVRIDIGDKLDGLAGAVASETASPADEDPSDHDIAPGDTVTAIAEAAIRAPSGGNAQPWTVRTGPDSVTIGIAPQYTSMMDVAYRGSAVAVGAAVFNARVAAAALHASASVSWTTPGESTPLQATVSLGSGKDAELAALYHPMLQRETNRHRGTPQPIGPDTMAALHGIAQREGARLSVLSKAGEIEEAARIFAAADRIRYLTPRLHQELIAELRWPGDEPSNSGIDVRSLELDPGGLAVLDLIKRPDVMAQLARWDAGEALGEDALERVRSASALVVITVRGRELVDFARGGSAAEAVWVTAQHHGLAVQPISPVFLHALRDDELEDLSPAFGSTLAALQSGFRHLAATEDLESQALVLRLAHARPASVASRRRELAQLPPMH